MDTRLSDDISFHQFHEVIEREALRHGGQISKLENGGTQLRFGSDELPTICIMSGLHGDERAGPLALLRFLGRETFFPPAGYSVLIFPLVNDVGWDGRQREWAEIDLNRSFGLPQSPGFLSQIAAEIDRCRPAAFIDLHEDSEVEYSYVFRYIKDEPHFAVGLQAELGARDEPWDDDPSWTGASECYARAHGTQLGVTLETPPAWPLETRVSWHVQALDFVVAQLPASLQCL